MAHRNHPLRSAPNVRSQFLLNPGLTFLNHGSFGAVPRAVFDAHTEWRRRIEADPIEFIVRRGSELLDTAKQSVAEFLGMNANDFGLVTNATEGINCVLRLLFNSIPVTSCSPPRTSTTRCGRR